MDTLPMEMCDTKELDDSGCVQDVSPRDGEQKTVELLDLSDDVLLYILKHCSPRDLKALGYTCPRLGRLIQDRTLWQYVDTRDQPTGRARMRWWLAHALGANTTELLLTGYAREARGCLGHVNRKRKEVEEEQAMKEKQKESSPGPSTSEQGESSSSNRNNASENPLERLHRLYSQQIASSPSPSWPDDGPLEVDPEDVVLLDGSCPGPQFTLTQCMLRQLRSQCSLTSLALQYCNINCNTTGINHFPPTLKKLSLRGAKCYNLPLDKSFLFNIQDYLPDLEYLDLSECEWLEPAAFLPLSKVTKLTHLILKDCCRLTEFVAYASLATRYGFRKLKVLDLRGSPVGDSEVSALGWLPALEELYVSPALGVPPRPPDHSHCRDERLPPHSELHAWEMEEPEYFKIKPQLTEPKDTRATTIDDIEEHIEQLRNYENNRCLHGMEYNLCMEGIRPRKRLDPEEEKKKEDNNKDSKVRQFLSITCTSYEPVPGPSQARNAEPDIEEIPTKKRKLSKEKDTTNNASTSKDLPKSKDAIKKSSKNKTIPKEHSDSDSSDEDNIPLKMLCRNTVNAGASTSKSPPKPPKSPPKDKNAKRKTPDRNPNSDKKYEYVTFRQNMDPIIVRRDAEEVEEENRQREERERQNLERQDNMNMEVRPRAHVLYVNVGQQLHTVYRLSIHNEPPIFYSFARNSHLRFRPNVGNIFYTPPTPHMDATSLVTDSAVRRFGRADVDDVNYIHIGPSAGVGDAGARPNRSNLRVLSITGFRNITDRSLVHLATAAPYLRFIDFSESRVTEQGVENFKSLRPDCEVKFSPYQEQEDSASV